MSEIERESLTTSLVCQKKNRCGSLYPHILVQRNTKGILEVYSVPLTFNLYFNSHITF